MWRIMKRKRRLLSRRQHRLMAEQMPSRVLEIGSGRRRPDPLFPVERGPRAACILVHQDGSRPTTGHRVLDIGDLGEFSERVDLVLCCDVLDHVADMPAAVRGLTQLSDDSGRVFVFTPCVYPYPVSAGHC